MTIFLRRINFSRHVLTLLWLSILLSRWSCACSFTVYIDVSSSLTFFYYLETFSLILFRISFKKIITPPHVYYSGMCYLRQILNLTWTKTAVRLLLQILSLFLSFIISIIPKQLLWHVIWSIFSSRFLFLAWSFQL